MLLSGIFPADPHMCGYNSKQPVDVRDEFGRIVIDPTRRKDFDLAELLKDITRGNLHEEVDFGAATGNET
jgi:antitoxin MazE